MSGWENKTEFSGDFHGTCPGHWSHSLCAYSMFTFPRNEKAELACSVCVFITEYIYTKIVTPVAVTSVLQLEPNHLSKSNL